MSDLHNEKQAFMKALKSVRDYDTGVTIGSYVGKLEKEFKQQQKQIQHLQKKEYALNQLVSKWNDYANNGTEQEQAEFFHEFRQTLNEIAFEKRDEHE